MVGMTHIHRKFQMQEVSVWVQFVPHIYRNGNIIPVDTLHALIQRIYGIFAKYEIKKYGYSDSP